MDVRDFINFIESKALFSPNDRILLAVSGGIDSSVMADLFHRAQFQFGIAHCNFNLRGNESDKDAEFVKLLATHMKVPFFMETFETAISASEKGISIQMAARELRYGWFEKIRQEHKYTYIATAHHLDDQVETFMVNLIRGTGIAGLHGIPVNNGTVIRPLMFAFRSNIEQYASRYTVSYRTDLSNHENKYLRNKLRHEIIPLLCSVNPEFPKSLTQSIRRIAEFEQIGNEVLSNWCNDVLVSNGNEKVVDIEKILQKIPVEPYMWALLSPYNFNETQVSNLIGCLKHENRKIFCSSTHQLIKERDCLVIRLNKQTVFERSFKIGSFALQKRIVKPLALILKRITDVHNFEIPASGNTASLNYQKLQFPLTIRKWKQGDAFFPLGMKKKKKLSDFFIDQKFSIKEKEQTWLLCSGEHIVWIIGHRIDHRYRVAPGTTEILYIVTRVTCHDFFIC